MEIMEIGIATLLPRCHHHPPASYTQPLPSSSSSCYHQISHSPSCTFNLVAPYKSPRSTISHLLPRPPFPFALISLPVLDSLFFLLRCPLSIMALCLASYPPTSLPLSPQQEEGGHKQGGHVLQAGEESEAQLRGLQHDGAEHSPAG